MALHSLDMESLLSVNMGNFSLADKKASFDQESNKKTALGMHQVDHARWSTEREAQSAMPGHVGLSNKPWAAMPDPSVLLQDANACLTEEDAPRLPLIEDFIGGLQVCKTNKHLAHAKSMYSYVCSLGLDAQDAVRNHILCMFVQCGSIASAQQVFNVMSDRSEHSWTSLITGYVQSGRPQHALELYPIMQEDSVLVSSYTLVPLIKACAQLRDYDQGQELYIQIVRQGLEQSLPVCSTLISMFSECGCIEEAHAVFDSLQSRDIVLWTALISGYVEHGLNERAIDCFEQMKQEGITPDAFTISCILKAYGNIGSLEKGRQLHKEINQMEFRKDTIVGYSLLGMYTKCGALSEAQQVFNELPVQELLPWNTLIGGYANHGLKNEALECYEQMQSQGIYPDVLTFASVLKVCGSFGALDRGRCLHMDYIQKGYEDSTLVGNSLVSMYARCGAILEAEKVFEGLQCKDVVSWTSLISGYAEHGLLDEALSCIVRMQVGGISPNSATFVRILKACGSIDCTHVSREVHMMILKMGLETSVLVSNSLLGMYGKSGLIEEAQVVFDNFTARDALSWTILIAGYGEHGNGQEAWQCFKMMRSEGVLPDPTTFACVFQACGITGAIKEGQELHLEIAQTELFQHPFIVNSLISMYVKCGLLAQAREVFDKATVCDAVAWTTLISGYSDFGPFQEAVDCFERMQLEGIFLDTVSFACALKACGSLGATKKGYELHMEVVKRGYHEYSLVGNTLVSMYSKGGLLMEAQEIFCKLPAVDRVSWNALIVGYVDFGPAEEVFKCMESMQLEGVSPDALTCSCALKACITIGDLDKAREIHSDVASKGLEREPVIGNMLVSLYAICGFLMEAQEIFDVLPSQEVPAWYALIAGYAEHGLGQEALCCFTDMQKLGVCPDAATYASALKACSSIGASDKGQELHTEIVEKGLETDVSVGNSLVSMYAKCGSLAEAEEVFDKLLVRDVVTWSSMIQGYGMRHEGTMALQCYEDMQEDGMKPDAVTFTCLLMACNHSNLVREGHDFFKSMNNFGIFSTIEHYTCMIGLFAKSGHLYDAERFVEMLCPPCEATWAALLSACKFHGEVELGLRCFQQLVRFGVEDAAWYVLLADTYANAGSSPDAYKVEELRKHAGAMKKLGVASIEVDKTIHQFVVADQKNEEITSLLDSLDSQMKADGHLPNLGQVLRPVLDDEKESVLCEHAEKLAIAFGLLNTPQGQTLRVTKNLRMCNECHEASKMVSRLEKREIILRDSCCIHHFKEGLCSCGDGF